jgi:hypothetical protein
VGIGLIPLLNQVGGPKLAGLIPLFVGLAMLLYVYVLAARID